MGSRELQRYKNVSRLPCKDSSTIARPASPRFHGIIAPSGNSAAKATTKGENAALKNGSPTDSNATLFKEGYEKVIKDAGYTIAADQSVPDWDNTKAGTIFEQIYTEVGGDLIGVASANDGLGGAAIAVLERNEVRPRDLRPRADLGELDPLRLAHFPEKRAGELGVGAEPLVPDLVERAGGLEVPQRLVDLGEQRA